MILPLIRLLNALNNHEGHADSHELEEITRRVAPELLSELAGWSTVQQESVNEWDFRDKIQRMLASKFARVFLKTFEAKLRSCSQELVGAVTYNVTNHNYGTVNNVGHAQNATFNGYGSPTSTYGPAHPSSYTESKDQPSGSASHPPHSFVIFALTYLKTHQPPEATHFSEARVDSTITAAWALIPPDDRAKINEDSERAEELHMAMLGGAEKGAKGERQKEKYRRQKEKYWTSTGSMLDFWTTKWREVQVKARRHAAAVGKAVLGMSSGSQPSPSGGGGCGGAMGANAEGRKGSGVTPGVGHRLPSILV